MYYCYVKAVNNNEIYLKVVDIRKIRGSITEDVIGSAKIEIGRNGWGVKVDVRYNLSLIRDRLFNYIMERGFNFKEGYYFRI